MTPASTLGATIDIGELDDLRAASDFGSRGGDRTTQLNFSPGRSGRGKVSRARLAERYVQAKAQAEFEARPDWNDAFAAHPDKLINMSFHGTARTLPECRARGNPIVGQRILAQVEPQARVAKHRLGGVGARIPIGARVVLNDGRSGMIKWNGYLDSKFVQTQTYFGIRLDAPSGRHDGLFRGKRYFFTPPFHGLLVTRQAIRVHMPPKESRFSGVSSTYREAGHFGGKDKAPQSAVMTSARRNRAAVRAKLSTAPASLGGHGAGARNFRGSRTGSPPTSPMSPGAAWIDAHVEDGDDVAAEVEVAAAAAAASPAHRAKGVQYSFEALRRKMQRAQELGRKLQEEEERREQEEAKRRSSAARREVRRRKVKTLSSTAARSLL